GQLFPRGTSAANPGGRRACRWLLRLFWPSAASCGYGRGLAATRSSPKRQPLQGQARVRPQRRVRRPPGPLPPQSDGFRRCHALENRDRTQVPQAFAPGGRAVRPAETFEQVVETLYHLRRGSFEGIPHRRLGQETYFAQLAAGLLAAGELLMIQVADQG